METIYPTRGILGHKHAGEKLPISNAVDAALDGFDTEADDAQIAIETCTRLRNAVGIMSEVLCRSGLMTAEELRLIVGDRFEVLS